MKRKTTQLSQQALNQNKKKAVAIKGNKLKKKRVKKLLSSRTNSHKQHHIPKMGCPLHEKNSIFVPRTK